MKIRVYREESRLNEAAAEMFVNLVRSKPDAVLGLATGGTPVGVYTAMAEAYRRGQVRYGQVTTFNLDEYVGLPEGHPESYRTYMYEHLFKHVDIAPERIHLPNGNAEDLLQECSRYEQLLAEAGYADLQLLGLGINGHIGFNEPGPELNSCTHIVQLAPETREANSRFFASIDEVPTHAVTMGIGSILKAKEIVLIAKGSGKAEAVRRALTGPVTTDCPASLLQTHPRLTVFLDEAAAVWIPSERIDSLNL